MREKYESLSLVVLKDLAKARGLKGISTMKKGELIDRMLQEDEREKRGSAEGKDGIYRADSFRTGKEESIHQNREEKSIRPIRRITAIRSMEKACMQNMEHMHHRNRSIRHRRIMTVLRSKKISSASTVEIQRAVFWRLWQTDSVLSAVKTICRGGT